MKKTLTLIALLLFISTISFAQEKTSVGILPFTFVSDAAKQEDVNSIQESVVNAFVKTRRFNIVDRTKMAALKVEKEIQKTDDFIDGKVVEQSKNIGAQYLVSGHIISAQTEQMKADEKNNLTGGITGKATISYKAKLLINLKVIDVTTGQVITSETIEPKSGSLIEGYFGVSSPTPSEALSKSIKKIEGKVDEFVSRNFPINFSIAEIQEKDSKGSAKVILLAGGTGFGLKKGDKLRVVEIVDVVVAGKKMTRRKEIGEIKITKVEDENFSICSVMEGGDVVASKFESNAKIQVISN